MRHAFLIIAHNNWEQVKKLICLLDAENHDIYIHADKRSKNFKDDEFYKVPNKSKIYIFQNYEVFWGGFSMIQAEILLFEQAHKNKYDYYHVISGADLPLKGNEEIDCFFERNHGKEFVSFDDHKLNNDPEITRRTKYYHFLLDYRRRYQQKWKNDFFTFWERVSLVMQIIFHINRVKGLDWTIKYGSNWVSITDDLVNEILKHKEKITKVFSFTNCADELLVQTVAYNCGFAEKIYQAQDSLSGNVRFIDWTRGKNGNPYTFTIQDKDFLFENGNLFARKFSETVDEEIIQCIYEKVQNENKR